MDLETKVSVLNDLTSFDFWIQVEKYLFSGLQDY